MGRADATARRHEMKNRQNKYRWAVWLDGRGPLMATSRREAKRIASRAKHRAHFSRSYACDGAINLSVSDFIVWKRGSDGRWFR